MYKSYWYQLFSMQNSTNASNEKLTKPANDVRYLLAREYSINTAIRFVSDHYRLTESERHILVRVVRPPKIATARRGKRLACTDINGRDVLIDGYNVLITIESMLKDETLWLGDDGFVRDTRGVFRSYNNTDATYKAVDKMLSFLSGCKVTSVNILLDTQMSKSGQLAHYIDNRFHIYSLNGSARTSRHVDFDLKNTDAKVVVATADGVIIDAVEKVIDITACLMEREGIEAMRIL